MEYVRIAPSRPTWRPVPILVRLRRSLALAALTGVLVALIRVLTSGLGEKAPPMVMLGLLVLWLATLAAGILGFVEFLTAFESGPGDGMSEYGTGQDVEIVWQGRRRLRGDARLVGAATADVDITPSRRRVDAPTTAVRVDGRTLHLRCGPGARAPTWHALVDESDREIARADAASGPARRGLFAPHAPIDWEVRCSDGLVLRLRHDHYTRPRRVTLLDPTGTAWSVEDGARAELPKGLAPLDALAIVVLVDRLGRAASSRNSERLHR